MNEVPPPPPSPLAGLSCPIGRRLDAGGERSSSGEDLANFSQYRHFPPARRARCSLFHEESFLPDTVPSSIICQDKVARL